MENKIVNKLDLIIMYNSRLEDLYMALSKKIEDSYFRDWFNDRSVERNVMLMELNRMIKETIGVHESGISSQWPFKKSWEAIDSPIIEQMDEQLISHMVSIEEKLCSQYKELLECIPEISLMREIINTHGEIIKKCLDELKYVKEFA